MGDVTQVVDGTLRGTGLGLETRDVTDLVGDLTALGGNEPLLELSTQQGLGVQVNTPELLSGVVGAELGLSANDAGIGLTADAAVLENVLELNTDTSVLGATGLLGADLSAGVLQDTLTVDTTASVLGADGLADVALGATAVVAGLEPIEVAADLAVNDDGIALGAELPLVDAGLGLGQTDGLNLDLGLGAPGSDLGVGLGLNPGTGLDLELGGPLQELPVVPDLGSPEPAPLTPTSSSVTPSESPDVFPAGTVRDLTTGSVTPENLSSQPVADAAAPRAQIARDTIARDLVDRAVDGDAAGPVQSVGLVNPAAQAALSVLPPAAQQELIPASDARRGGASETNPVVKLWQSLMTVRDGSSVSSGAGGQTLLAVTFAMAALFCAIVVLKPLAQGEVRLLSFTHQTLVPPG